MSKTPWVGLILAGALTASAAGAQSPTQSPAAASSAPSVPEMTCKQPTPPGDDATPKQVNQFNQDAKAYQVCVQDYVNARQADLQKYQNLAKANAAAANAAIKSFNDFVKQLQAKNKDKGESH